MQTKIKNLGGKFGKLCMLLELAIGDAYGAAFEFVPQSLIHGHRIGLYRRHPTHNILPGRYTDDTQMSLAVAELLLSGEEFTKENMADYFVLAFRRDPREGYARGFYRLLQSVTDGSQLLQHIRPRSDKNGAAMRVAPIGLCPQVGQVIALARLQAQVTHDSPQGISAAIAVALTVHYFHFDKGPKADLPAYLRGFVLGPWDQVWHGPVDVKGLSCVKAAVSAIVESSSATRLLERCIQFGGDTDTTAAIALAAASCCREIDPDLPRHLHRGLESGPFGAHYIRRLDEGLLGLHMRSQG